MALNSEAAGLSLLTFESAALSYSAWLPSILTLRTFGDNPLSQQDALQGMAIGTGFNLITGFGASILAKHPLPLFAAIAGSVIGLTVYLYALSTAHGQGSMRAQQEPANG